LSLRVLAGAAYFTGVILGLGSLWSLRNPGYDLDEPSTQADSWRGDARGMTVMLVMGLAVLGGVGLVLTLRGRGRRSLRIASACAGLVAIAGGTAMIPEGSGYCYVVPAPGVGFNQRRPCGWVRAEFDDYIAFYRHIPWVVIGAGLMMLVLSVLTWLISRRHAPVI
jgi:hypothetical protein